MENYEGEDWKNFWTDKMRENWKYKRGKKFNKKIS